MQQASIQKQLPYDGAYVPTSQDVLVVLDVLVVMCMAARREEGREPGYKLVFGPNRKSSSMLPALIQAIIFA